MKHTICFVLAKGFHNHKLNNILWRHFPFNTIYFQFLSRCLVTYWEVRNKKQNNHLGADEVFFNFT